MSGAMRNLLSIAVLLIVTSSAQASEESGRLQAQGLVDYHAGRYPEALELFDRAVMLDPNDVYSRYYRGVTRTQTGDYPGSVEDLKAVAEARPDLEQVQLDLGYALVQQQEYAAAVEPLQKAQQSEGLKAEASLYLGMAHIGMKRHDEARADLQAAAAVNPQLQPVVQYYEGVNESFSGNREVAEERFKAVAAAQPDSEIGRQAQSYLASGGPRRGVGVADRPRSLLYAEAGFQYDSNVTLAPGDADARNELDVSNKADGRAIIVAGGNYAPWNSDRGSLNLSYEFFQSLHFDVTEFDMQDHRPNAEIALNLGPVRAGLFGRYDFYLLDFDPLLHEFVALPWLSVPEASFGRSDVYFRSRTRNYVTEPYDSQRDAENYAAGFVQFFYIGDPDRFVSVGYQYDRDDSMKSAGKPFDYNGHQAELAFGWLLPFDVAFETSYAYRHEDYFQSASLGREDDEHRVIVVGEVPIGELFHVSLGYLGRFGDSTDKAFEYDRHIVSLSAGVRF